MMRAVVYTATLALFVQAKTASFIIHATSPSRTLPSTPYVCVTLDWWPDNKCDAPDGVSDCSWSGANVLTAPVSSPQVKKAMEGFGDVILRIGGTLEDQITYAVGEDTDIYCPDFNPPPPEPSKYFTGGCLTSSRWQELMNFCPSSSNCRMLFGINAMRGRECNVTVSDLPTCGDPRDSCTSSWDSSNAQALIRATAAAGFEMLGYELGNELDCLRADQYTESFTQFHTMISDIMMEYGLPMPSVIATDSYEYIPPMVKNFLPQVQELITAYTWHHYPLHSGIYCTGPETAEDSEAVDKIIMDPDGMKVLFKLADVLDNMVASVTTVDPRIQLWMGETGGAFNSGCNGSTNAFMSGFWYLPAMAGLAEKGHDIFCRQTLMGGNYELIDKVSLLPNPDYFSAVLYSRLMGPRLLHVEATESQDAIRIYSHCTTNTPGSVTVLFLNYVDTDMTIDITIDGVNVIDVTRDEYILTAAAAGSPTIDLLHSNKVALNGEVLTPAADGTVPIMNPVTRNGGDIIVPGYSYGYIVFSDVHAAACL